MYTIYMHRNKLNNKVYIGQTKQEKLNNRWKNGKGYKTCTYFYKAIQKYGWDNFEHIILEQGDWTLEEVNQKEQFYIQKYDSTNNKKGYNIKEGGGNDISPNALPAAIKWMKEHPEFGLARAADMLKWQAEHPEEVKLHRQKAQQAMVNARKRKVRCIETGIIYESAAEAARQVPNTHPSKICMVCRGQRKTCGKLHWEYVDEERSNKNE